MGYCGLVDQLYAAGICGVARLVDVLERWSDDSEVFLPRGEIDKRLRLLLNAPGAV